MTKVVLTRTTMRLPQVGEAYKQDLTLTTAELFESLGVDPEYEVDKNILTMIIRRKSNGHDQG